MLAVTLWARQTPWTSPFLGMQNESLGLYWDDTIQPKGKMQMRPVHSVPCALLLPGCYSDKPRACASPPLLRRFKQQCSLPPGNKPGSSENIHRTESSREVPHCGGSCWKPILAMPVLSLDAESESGIPKSLCGDLPLETMEELEHTCPQPRSVSE